MAGPLSPRSGQVQAISAGACPPLFGQLGVQAPLAHRARAAAGRLKKKSWTAPGKMKWNAPGPTHSKKKNFIPMTFGAISKMLVALRGQMRSHPVSTRPVPPP